MMLKCLAEEFWKSQDRPAAQESLPRPADERFAGLIDVSDLAIGREDDDGVIDAIEDTRNLIYRNLIISRMLNPRRIHVHSLEASLQLIKRM
jgi:hypothetical protein